MQCGDFKTTYADDMTIFDARSTRVMVFLFICLIFTLPLYSSSYTLSLIHI